MTNQLFRDYLDGRIQPGQFAKGGQLTVRPMPEHSEPMPLLPWQRDFIGRLTSPDFVKYFLGEWIKPPPTDDPRARALTAKRTRGHGPTIDDLRRRGRVTRYKEKS